VLLQCPIKVDELFRPGTGGACLSKEVPLESIILGKPFLKSVRATIDKTRGIINMKVDRVHEKFIYHPNNLTCCC
jgi:hypothetical protein